MLQYTFIVVKLFLIYFGLLKIKKTYMFLEISKLILKLNTKIKMYNLTLTFYQYDGVYYRWWFLKWGAKI